jgi:hypothetical protein
MQNENAFIPVYSPNNQNQQELIPEQEKTYNINISFECLNHLLQI